ncbi:hypothetical protein CLG96_17535 [Sphingomonas oleivorans]|uniref:Uncharacterized protein n=2 Tax=Sphingomonas oleivorans TaxID=1735121 RepID=A0A2T5FTF9_9SPHN|nr:hypothetical protein CLG96_17535 [Sphingomonas oleivorans]
MNRGAGRQGRSRPFPFGTANQTETEKIMQASPIILSIAMIAALALALGGGRLIATAQDRRRGVLMLVAAAVIVFNVVIWAMPV